MQMMRTTRGRIRLRPSTGSGLRRDKSEFDPTIRGADFSPRARSPALERTRERPDNAEIGACPAHSHEEA